jgi:hypothetical protein
MKNQFNGESYFPEENEFSESEEISMNSVYIDPPCFTEFTDPEINDKYSFEVNFYLEYKICKLLKKFPPENSYFETEWKDSESVPYAAVYFYYKSKLKNHRDYAGKVSNLISTKRFDKSCKKDFETEFKKFVKK